MFRNLGGWENVGALSRLRSRFLSPFMSLSLFRTTRAIAARGRVMRAFLFFCAVLLAPRAWQRWHQVLATTLAGWPDVLRFSLTQKVFRPFLRRRLSAAERIAIIDFHYRTLRPYLLPVFDDFDTWPGLRLATLTGKSGQGYDLFLTRARAKEGEMDLFLRDPVTGAGLAMLAVVLGQDAGRCVLFVGGLRGVKPPQGKPEIVAATRDLHGLRPKAAVFEAACELAAWFGAEAIIAPSLANHITRWAGGEVRQIHADYDAFWAEYTAERRADGDYVIRLPRGRREATAVKSRKRAEWLRRQALVEDLSAQIAKQLG